MRHYDISETNHYQFLRQDGIVAGIAGGIAYSFDLPIWAVRLVMLFSFFASCGLTLIFYFVAAFSFTSKSRYQTYGDSPKFLGVCYDLAPIIGLDVGWLRFAILLLSIFTGFFPVPFLYFLTYFMMKSN